MKIIRENTRGPVNSTGLFSILDVCKNSRIDSTALGVLKDIDINTGILDTYNKLGIDTDTLRVLKNTSINPGILSIKHYKEVKRNDDEENREQIPFFRPLQ